MLNIPFDSSYLGVEAICGECGVSGQVYAHGINAAGCRACGATFLSQGNLDEHMLKLRSSDADTSANVIAAPPPALPLHIVDPDPEYVILFHDREGEIGRLFVKDSRLVFVGKVEESAKAFLNYLCNAWNRPNIV